MSFTPAAGGADRSFELVRRSLLQGDGLAFAEALTVEQIQQAFAAEGVSFGDASRDSAVPAVNAATGHAVSEGGDGIVYTMGVTLWAMLSQALFTDVQRACVAAAQRVAVYYALRGRDVSSTNTCAGEGAGGSGPASGRGRGGALRDGRRRRVAVARAPHAGH